MSSAGLQGACAFPQGGRNPLARDCQSLSNPLAKPSFHNPIPQRCTMSLLQASDAILCDHQYHCFIRPWRCFSFACGAGSPSGNTPPGDAADSTAVIALPPLPIQADYRPTWPRDAGRRPEAILAFAGLRPGMTVLDMFSGGGYYTQLAASVVGPDGRVVAHNNTTFATIAGKEIEQRFADGRLAAVERLIGENNKLKLPAQYLRCGAYSSSATTMSTTLDGQRGWELIDRPSHAGRVAFRGKARWRRGGHRPHSRLRDAPGGRGRAASYRSGPDNCGLHRSRFSIRCRKRCVVQSSRPARRNCHGAAYPRKNRPRGPSLHQAGNSLRRART